MGKKYESVFENSFRMERTIEVSIIIVNYKVEKELLECIDSIKKSNTKTQYEIIVIDNSENNVGYGAGNNLGAKKAKGEFLFFLNPDTKVFPGTIDNLVELIKKEKNVGIVAPLLLDQNQNPYKLQGSKTRRLRDIEPFIRLRFGR